MIQNYIKGVSKDEIISKLGKIDNLTVLEKNRLIYKCIKYGIVDFVPRNKDGICFYDPKYKDENDERDGQYDEDMGGVNWYGQKIKELPNNFTITCNLAIIWNDLKKIPDNLTVNGYFDCSSNQLTELPNTLKVKSDLYCTSNAITKLPDNFRVNGEFNCSENKLTKLPENLYVEGDLICSDQETGIILKLPKSAVVKGDFIN